MLGRRADQIYWMARYTERAENTARILDVTYRMSLIPQAREAQLSAWQSAVRIAGDPDLYAETYGEISRAHAVRHLALDADHSSSIFSSISAARENARALRATIPTEMWESLNTTWLEIQEIGEDSLTARGHQSFFDWVKERMILFRGVAEGTMVRNEGYAFAELGWNLERADNTARLLDSKYHILLPTLEEVGGAVDYYQWGAVLRSVGAFRAYHKIYHDVVTPYRVAELLILRRDLPRSLRTCVEQMVEILEEMSAAGGDKECQRIVGRIYARLRYGKIEEIFDSGLHEFLIQFIEDNAGLGTQIERDFMMIQ